MISHRCTNTRLYRIWNGMKYRCTNPNCKDYMRYGGRGITVCDEWECDFAAFRAWAIENGYSDELTIDRIDNNKGYSPENCRWATNKEQQRNMRSNRLVEMDGETKPVTEWAETSAINPSTLHNRLFRYGWSLGRSLATPLHSNRGKLLRKSVCQCDEDGNILATFESVTAASQATGASRCHISSVLHGKRKKSGGYYWKFATEEKGGMNIELVSD